MYPNDKIYLKCENDKQSYDITLNLKNIYVDEDKVLLNPIIINNGLLRKLMKARIIKEICSFTTYDGINIPIAKLNMGILKKYDSIGVKKYKERFAYE